MSETQNYKNGIPLGKGELHCDCCRPPGTLKEIKQLINRGFRRKQKQQDKKEQSYVEEITSP